jgi:hypothetical protein
MSSEPCSTRRCPVKGVVSDFSLGFLPGTRPQKREKLLTLFLPVATSRPNKLRASGKGRNKYGHFRGVERDENLGRDARRLPARSRLPLIRGHTPSAPRYGLRGVGCLKQIPNAVFQQLDGPLQSAELSNPHYCDGQVQLK